MEAARKLHEGENRASRILSTRKSVFPGDDDIAGYNSNGDVDNDDDNINNDNSNNSYNNNSHDNNKLY